MYMWQCITRLLSLIGHDYNRNIHSVMSLCLFSQSLRIDDASNKYTYFINAIVFIFHNSLQDSENTFIHLSRTVWGRPLASIRILVTDRRLDSAFGKGNVSAAMVTFHIPTYSHFPFWKPGSLALTYLCWRSKVHNCKANRVAYITLHAATLFPRVFIY
jgi:hypothetical protein